MSDTTHSEELKPGVEGSQGDESMKTTDSPLSDLEARANISGGTIYKSTDVTLKRGIVG